MLDHITLHFDQANICLSNQDINRIMPTTNNTFVERHSVVASEALVEQISHKRY